VKRFYVRIGERQVHVRSLGEGPTVVLLHQSPKSSQELVPLMEVLSRDFHVLAPDTPGYGLSDPLAPSDEEPGIDDFVDALARLFDALGLGCVPLFGTHTGAIQAVRFAVRYPHKVHSLVANGVLINDAQERADLVQHYFPRFEPHWDGSHLPWLWSRLLDQYTFFPWYARSPDKRFSWPASLEEMDLSALEFLQAGDNYRAAYRAVVDYAIADDLARLSVPSCLLVAQPDPLSESVADYPALPDCVAVQVVPEFADIAAATQQFLRAQAPCETVSLPGAPSPPGGVYRRFVHTALGNVHLRAAGKAAARRPVLCLHEPGASSRSCIELMGAMAPLRHLIAPDLPGHGDTDVSGLCSVEEMASFVEKLLDDLGLDSVDVVTLGASWTYGAALVKSIPERVAGIAFCNPDVVSNAQVLQQSLPDLAPDAAGSHLQRAWFYLRDKQLFFPWSERGEDNIIHGLVRVTSRRLHEQLVDLLKSRSSADECLRACWSVPIDRLSACSRATLLAYAWHPVHGVAAIPEVLPDEPYRWGPAVEQALHRSAAQ
jgi:pimeloyl-ACP methyl ester carboxylesterase